MVNRELIEVFSEIAREKNVERSELGSILEGLFLHLVERERGDSSNCSVIVNLDKGEFEIYVEKTIVDEVEDPVMEITLEEISQVDAEMAKDLEREKNENQPNLERTEENDEKVEETVKSVVPTVAALERLEKAVNKEPDPDLFNRPKPRNAYLDGYEKENISYNPLNSLIRRMTGAKDKVSHLEKAINPVETFTQAEPL